jgi:hypothetical protein
MSGSAPTPLEAAAIREAYFAGTQLWTVCDWDTDPAGDRPNLNGVTAAEAEDKAAAATGAAARWWAAAAGWLAAVEDDIEAARDAALNAVLAATDGHLGTAVAFAKIAVDTATPYSRADVWLPLYRVLERLRDRATPIELEDLPRHVFDAPASERPDSWTP